MGHGASAGMVLLVDCIGMGWDGMGWDGMC